MPSYINTNIASLNAQRNLTGSQATLNTALQRLSSGLRINSAKDDAAGMAIANRMSAQINGANQAVRNANDGISMAQTAEGSMVQIGNNLQRIRDLAVQASNASNSAADRAALNAEATQLVAEIDRVATGTSFNGVKLLDGTFTAQNFQVGADAGASNQISIANIQSAKAASLGVGSGSSYSAALSGTSNSGALNSGDLSINGVVVGASSSDGVSSTSSMTSGIAKAAAINAISSSTGVTASVGATSVAGTATAATNSSTAIAAGDILINGVDIGALAATTTGGERGAQMAAAINAKATQTGVTATFDTATSAVTLTAADGRNIAITKSVNAAANDTNTGLTTGIAAVTAGVAISRSTVSLSSTSTSGITVASGGGTGALAASTGVATSAGTAAINAGDIVINGVNVGAIASGAGTLATQLTNVMGAINAVSTQTGVSASSSGTGITLTSISGGIQLNTKGTATAAATGFTFGATAVAGAGATATGLAAGNKAATVTTGAGISSLDLSTAAGAAAALGTIDAALNNVNSSRASLGAYQNRFSSAVNSLQATSENLSASRSRILDTDFAAETAALTRSQILQQAGTAMLAQANQIPNGVLALLR